MKRDSATRDGGLLPPVAVFVVLLTVGAAGAIFLVAGRSSSPERSATAPSESVSANEGTKVRPELLFRRLEEQSFRAFEERDLSLMRGLYTEDSPVREAAIADVQRLTRDRTRVQIDSLTTELWVDSVTTDEIRLTQKVVLDLSFFSAQGVEVTEGSAEERQTIEWVLRREDATWLIHDSVVVSASPCEKRTEC